MNEPRKSIYGNTLHLKMNIKQKYYMSVNSNSTASQQNIKNFLSQSFSFIAGVVDTSDQLYFWISLWYLYSKKKTRMHAVEISRLGTFKFEKSSGQLIFT